MEGKGWQHAVTRKLRMQYDIEKGKGLLLDRAREVDGEEQRRRPDERTTETPHALAAAILEIKILEAFLMSAPRKLHMRWLLQYSK